MIATNEAADVLRHGWQDAASSLAADVPEVADVLHARLEQAITSQRLDELSLLAMVEEVESITSRAGSESGEALAVRLRRTVYEYLLALDATQPTVPVSVPDEAQPAVASGPMDGAAEIAALGHVAPAAVPVEAAEPATPPAAAAPVVTEESSDGDGEEMITAEGRATRRRFGLRRRHPGEDDDAATAAGDEDDADLDLPLDSHPGADDPAAPDHLAPPFVAPRAGFHISEEDGEGGGIDQDATPIQMPVFASDEARAGVAAQAAPPAPDTSGGQEASVDAEFLAFRPPVTDDGIEAAAAPDPPRAAPASAAAPPPDPLAPRTDREAPAAAVAAPATAPAAFVPEAADNDPGIHPGWKVRDHQQAARKRGIGGTHAVADTEDDPFGINPKLAELRRRIEDRLRRKRCDDAAAMLQSLAQETGGRAVAELAMNAGDRCRALGKSNAALNCYLAASRADPVFELPLSRLADVCIDAQDTDLAVSYLERIARLYRFRGDEKNALRVYRRIATVAPYREDVLALLSNAQTTGRLD